MKFSRMVTRALMILVGALAILVLPQHTAMAEEPDMASNAQVMEWHPAACQQEVLDIEEGKHWGN